jgi:hypothetical protein
MRRVMVVVVVMMTRRIGGSVGLSSALPILVMLVMRLHVVMVPGL